MTATTDTVFYDQKCMVMRILVCIMVTCVRLYFVPCTTTRKESDVEYI
jgi:hypothetical protein